MGMESRRLYLREYTKNYYQEHKAKVAEKNRHYYQEHKAEIAENGKRWYREHRTEILGKKNARRERSRLVVLDHYSNGTMVCVRCEFSDVRALCLDHINGGGNQHRKNVGGMDFFASIIASGYPDGFQVLCANCNTIKERDRSGFGLIALDGEANLGI